MPRAEVLMHPFGLDITHVFQTPATGFVISDTALFTVTGVVGGLVAALGVLFRLLIASHNRELAAKELQISEELKNHRQEVTNLIEGYRQRVEEITRERDLYRDMLLDLKQYANKATDLAQEAVQEAQRARSR